MFEKTIGIDLGTANVIVSVRGKGVVANEPSVVAVSSDNKIIAVGKEAKMMLGKSPDDITVFRPLRSGVIADYRITLAMLKYFIRKAMGLFWISRPDVMISIPVGATSTERKAVIDAGIEAGAKRVFLIKEPLAAAIGAGLPVGEPTGSMVVNIGGGTSEIATISLGGILAATSLRVAGDSFDESIMQYIKKTHNIAIGEVTAEKIKINIGSATEVPDEDQLVMTVKGRDLITGLPKSVDIKTNDVSRCLKSNLEEIVSAIRQVLEKTPPEVSSDIIDNGIYLTGGSGQIRNLDNFISERINVPVFVAKDAQFCVAKGTTIALESLEYYKRGITS